MRYALIFALVFWFAVAKIAFGADHTWIVRYNQRCPGHWVVGILKTSTKKDAERIKKSLYRLYGKRLGSVVIYRGVR